MHTSVAGDRRLLIHTRHVLGRDGLRTIEECVDCPPRDRSVPVDECVACPRCTNLSYSGDGSSSLACALPDGPDPDPDDARRVRAVMTRVVYCVRQEVTLQALTSMLLERCIGGAPVVDGAGKVLGVVSKTDILRTVEQGVELGTATVGTIMTPVAFVLRDDATIARAAALMAFEGVHRIPVVARDGVLIGIVTPMDVTRWFARNDGQPL